MWVRTPQGSPGSDSAGQRGGTTRFATVLLGAPFVAEVIACDRQPEQREALVALTSWAERHRRAIAEARTRYDAEHA
ncbi:hypothetical protein [Micromonospora chokoriensis]|uniref:Uncharacterized protein n=1 Tax=Micromonospora chokoriensis TaxID=356851 RepID=A0A1C4W9J7_9ACTN|nr:hypothetical protein [Micromonospora chokoriensis]SCE92799.1 hypothetical protein GA0070612_2260 [Micromonospora chokoriensis]